MEDGRKGNAQVLAEPVLVCLAVAAEHREEPVLCIELVSWGGMVRFSSEICGYAE